MFSYFFSSFLSSYSLFIIEKLSTYSSMEPLYDMQLILILVS